jgi:hypothetical protein
MQVLEILQSSGQDLYPEDLAFFEAELDTGDYAPKYIDQCKELILQIRQQKKQTQKQSVQEAIPSNLLVDPDRLIPGTEHKEKTPEERLADMDREIRQMRTANNYKTRFRQYLTEHPEIDESFIDRHITLFEPTELEIILMTMQLSEGFLDKYFTVLDADKIARYQFFSEKFFIRHYARLDVATVLTKGKNEWRKKENRTSQLDVFLRLKGVKL